MKIINVVKTNEGAGWAYRHVEWIMRNSEGYEFINVLPNDKGGFAEKYKALGCKVIGLDMSLPIKKPWLFFKLRKQVRKVIDEEKPDIIHSHFVTTTLMLRLALGNKSPKRIFQVPGPLHLESHFFRLIDKLTIMQNDYLVGSCKWTCDTYRKMGIPDNRIFLDYYGGPISDNNEDGDILRSTYNISQSTPLVGMVSYFYAPKYYLLQFTGLKGHEDFIKAMKIVRERVPNVKAIVVGSAWGRANKYEAKIKKLAERKCPGCFIFTGYRADVKEIYHEMNVAVHPSHSENIGGAGESLGLAVPTISTNVGGFTDIVQNGITGWTVEKKNYHQLADRIIWMLEHQTEGKKMAMQGQQLCTEILSIDVTAKHMTEIYDIIMKG